jgi:hypothetical protein
MSLIAETVSDFAPAAPLFQLDVKPTVYDFESIYKLHSAAYHGDLTRFIEILQSINVHYYYPEIKIALHIAYTAGHHDFVSEVACLPVLAFMAMDNTESSESNEMPEPVSLTELDPIGPVMCELFQPTPLTEPMMPAMNQAQPPRSPKTLARMETIKKQVKGMAKRMGTDRGCLHEG